MKLIEKLCKPIPLTILGLLFLGSYTLLNNVHHSFSVLSIQELSGGKAMLNVLPYYNAEQAYEHLLSYSEQVLRIYQNVLWIDMFFLIPIYVLFLSSALMFYTSKYVSNKVVSKVLVGLPIIAGGLNYVEDIMGFYLITNLPNKLYVLASISGIITSTKTALISISILSAILFMGYQVIYSGYSKLKQIPPNK